MEGILFSYPIKIFSDKAVLRRTAQRNRRVAYELFMADQCRLVPYGKREVLHIIYHRFEHVKLSIVNRDLGLFASLAYSMNIKLNFMRPLC